MTLLIVALLCGGAFQLRAAEEETRPDAPVEAPATLTPPEGRAPKGSPPVDASKGAAFQLGTVIQGWSVTDQTRGGSADPRTNVTTSMRVRRGELYLKGDVTSKSSWWVMIDVARVFEPVDQTLLVAGAADPSEASSPSKASSPSWSARADWSTPGASPLVAGRQSSSSCVSTEGPRSHRGRRDARTDRKRRPSRLARRGMERMPRRTGSSSLDALIRAAFHD